MTIPWLVVSPHQQESRISLNTLPTLTVLVQTCVKEMSYLRLQDLQSDIWHN